MQFILSFAYIQTSPVSIIKLSLKLDTSGIFSRVLLDIQKMLRSEHQFQIWNLKQDPCCTTCQNCFVEYVSPRLTSQTSNSMFFMTSLKHLILAFTRLRSAHHLELKPPASKLYVTLQTRYVFSRGQFQETRKHWIYWFKSYYQKTTEKSVQFWKSQFQQARSPLKRNLNHV